jgi:hypothetical protein
MRPARKGATSKRKPPLLMQILRASLRSLHFMTFCAPGTLTSAMSSPCRRISATLVNLLRVNPRRFHLYHKRESHTREMATSGSVEHMYATKWMALYGKHDEESVMRFSSFFSRSLLFARMRTCDCSNSGWIEAGSEAGQSHKHTHTHTHTHTNTHKCT